MVAQALGWTSCLRWLDAPFKTHVGIHFAHASGRDAHAPVFYLHLEPGNCLAAAGVWLLASS